MEQIQLNPLVLTYSRWYPLLWIMGSCTLGSYTGDVCVYIFNNVAFWLFGVNEGLYESCCSAIQRGGAALHFYPPVPAGMVGVLSLFSNAVFMATKTEEQTLAHIISPKLTARCLSGDVAIFDLRIQTAWESLPAHIFIYIPFIFAILHEMISFPSLTESSVNVLYVNWVVYFVSPNRCINDRHDLGAHLLEICFSWAYDKYISNYQYECIYNINVLNC